MIDTLRDEMRNAVDELCRWPSEAVRIYHHNDADGLSSSAILTRSLAGKGYRIQRFCLEKPYPQVLQKIFDQRGRILIFADFAGRIAPLLAELNQGHNLVLILDHHPASPFTAARMHNLNPELYGIKGDQDISASTTCLMFACELDPANANLAHLAVIGAVGDQFQDVGRLTGENRRAMLEAAAQGTIATVPENHGEAYKLVINETERPVREVVTMLDTLGAAGYYQGGPELAVEHLLCGVSEEAVERHQAMANLKTAAFELMVKRLASGGLHQTTHFQWFHAGDHFSPMGVKMIGVFCQYIRKLRVIDPKKYIVGFQKLPDEVPGFGDIRFNADKISMRVPSALANQIRNGDKPGLDTFFPQATEWLGGFSDGCHSLAAATTLACGNAQALIGEMERILSRT